MRYLATDMKKDTVVAMAIQLVTAIPTATVEVAAATAQGEARLVAEAMAVAVVTRCPTLVLAYKSKIGVSYPQQLKHCSRTNAS